ncbi:hypothetical protein [Desulfoferula mesophila]|uniref:Uncharacterized protein n=1 Tax=Desulfoferula mesophila TaxID=3058419 RepID=A0AAU9EIS9_9BACT|nr:hypothetical protein FAK_40240 [Desulfoferula mesophilus]
MGRLGTTILCVCYGIALLGLIFLIDKHEDLVSSIALFIMAGWGIWWVIKKIAHSEDKREAVKLLFFIVAGIVALVLLVIVLHFSLVIGFLFVWVFEYLLFKIDSKQD